MTRSSNAGLVDALEDPESLFGRRIISITEQESDTSVSSDPNLDSSSTSSKTSSTSMAGEEERNLLPPNEDN
jgi:hypothetical protein